MDEPFPDPHTKSILMSCVHKENGDFDFMGGSFHFKFSFWHYLTLDSDLWARMDNVGQGNAHWALLRHRLLHVLLHGLDWEGFGSTEVTGWLLGEAARSLTRVQWSQCQWCQCEPTAGQGWAQRGSGSTSGIKGLRRGKSCSRVAIAKEKGENMREKQFCRAQVHRGLSCERDPTLSRKEWGALRRKE